MKRCSEVGGRGIFAELDLRAGSIVCTSLAVGFAVFGPGKNLCHVCLRRGCAAVGGRGGGGSGDGRKGDGSGALVSLQRCSGCNFAMYCSKEHQRLAWKCGHNVECAALRRQRKKGRTEVGSTVRLAAQVLHRQSQHRVDDDEDFILTRMEVHRSHYLQIQGDQVASMALAVADFIRPEGISKEDTANMERIDPEVEMICRLLCNAATVCDSELRSLGLGLFPQASLFNHSCDPNCAQSFRVDEATGTVMMVVRTLRPVQDGEELTIAYIDLMQTRRKRREALWRGYAFECACRRCSNDAADEAVIAASERGEEISVAVEEEEKLVEAVETKRRKGKSSEARTLLETALIGSTRRFSSPVLEAKCWYLLVHVLVEEGEFGSETVEAAKTSVERCRTAGLSMNSAVVALQLATLGKLQLYNGELIDAAETLTRAVDALNVLYGEKDDVALNCEIMLEQARYEQRGKEHDQVEGMRR